MPRLTQIKETKKGRLALFLDGEFAFSLDEDTFAAAALHQDDELEDWQIEELRKKSETRRALDKAMDYLSLRDHAAGELYQKLCRKFDAHSAAYAVVRAGDAFRTPPLIHPSLPKQPSRDVHVPTDGYHLPGCTWGNGPAGPRKVARITHNIKHDRRGERQMPDPGRQHRGREAFQPQPNEHRS